MIPVTTLVHSLLRETGKNKTEEGKGCLNCTRVLHEAVNLLTKTWFFLAGPYVEYLGNTFK